MINTQKAKVGILSLAFRGLLVDYPQKGKRNDSLANLHKAQKDYRPVAETEYLIDIPSHWNWSRLGYVTNNHGQTVPDKDFCYVDVGTLDNVHQRLAATENLVAAKDAPSRARKIIQVGDVLYSTVRPYLHNICIVDRQFSRTPIASTAFCVMQVNDSVLVNRFLFYWLLTKEFDAYSNGDFSKGTLYPAIGEKDLLRGVIPIPPLEEQSLIVEKIGAIFSALDAIDALQAQYADNLTVLKSKLLDAAIQGKLTEQLPEDGTAEELYSRIQAAKQALLEAGKLKKEKPLPEITADEMPFEIPKNWKWIRLGDYCQKITDQVASGSFAALRENVKSLKTPDYAIMVKTADFSNGFQKNLTYTDKHGYEFLSNSNLFGGELILSNVGSVGKCFIVPKMPCKMTLAPNAVMIRMVEEAGKDYLYYFLTSPQGFRELDAISTGVAVKKFNKTELQEILVPLPPLGEQQRIVTHLQETFRVLGV